MDAGIANELEIIILKGDIHEQLLGSSGCNEGDKNNTSSESFFC